MPLIRATGLDDPRVREFADLSDPDLLHRRGLFVAEGRLVVRRVIESGRYRVRSVLVSDAARASLAPLLETVADGVPVLVCDARDFLDVTGFNIHRGCLALVERPTPTPLDVALTSARLVIVLEAVGNPDNVGGVFRSASAFGVDAVVLGPGCTDPLYRKAIRTSMGAALDVPFVRLEAIAEVVACARAAGFRIVALTPLATAEPLEAFAARPRPARMALVVGAEGEGLSDAALGAADHLVRIPIRPSVDSLNLAVATAIALYRLSAG
jgi:tRNA G18 (ribose-2'-O)-methylase SpoU